MESVWVDALVSVLFDCALEVSTAEGFVCRVSADQYAPHTVAGRKLLAHELAHVMQQHPGTPGPSRSVVRQGRSSHSGFSPPHT